MKYCITLQSSLIIEAKTPEEAADQVYDALEDACKRNCSGIEDEILTNSTIMKTKIEESNNE